jgi:hypothetical protein
MVVERIMVERGWSLASGPWWNEYRRQRSTDPTAAGGQMPAFNNGPTSGALHLRGR